MSIECHYAECPHHGIHFEGEGSFCEQEQCLQTPREIAMYQRRQRLEQAGYDLEKLEEDSPFNFPVSDL